MSFGHCAPLVSLALLIMVNNQVEELRVRWALKRVEHALEESPAQCVLNYVVRKGKGRVSSREVPEIPMPVLTINFLTSCHSIAAQLVLSLVLSSIWLKSTISLIPS
jgi:hypothetical protein